MEIFKDIPGYVGSYQMSDFGRVKSMKRKGVSSDRILKPGTDNNGYLQVALSMDGKVKSYKVHILEAIVFLGLVQNERKIVVKHIDNIKTNNKLSNLCFY